MSAGSLQKRNHGDLAKYDPDKAVKKIRVLDAVQKHWEKARDAEQLAIVIRAKATEQAEFVFWWDTQAAKDDGGRPAKTGRKKSTSFDRLEDYGLDKFMVHQWRKKFGDPDKFERHVEIEIEHARSRIECERREQRVSKNTGEFEWYTPADIIEAARRTLGAIDLDPATSEAANSVVCAAQIFTADENGLDQQWDGRVFMNPPYSQPLITQFCQKLAASWRASTVTAAIVLVNNATETQWFRALAECAGAVCFPDGRVRFWNPDKATAAPLQGQAILYLGGEREAFRAEFESFGLVWVKP